MKSKEEIKQWLLENAVDECGTVDLSGIDFGNMSVDFSGTKAEHIRNDNQEAKYSIYNDTQKAEYSIYNDYQKAEYDIHNDNQEAKYSIYNDTQKAEYNIHNDYQKAEYNIYNDTQKAEYNIHNDNQKAEKYLNTHNAIINGVYHDVDLSDGIYTIIHKKRTYNGVTYIQGERVSGNITHIFKNDLVAYHAPTKEKAKDGFKRKLKGFEVKQEIIDEIKETKRVTRTQYHELTGACEIGIQAFADRIGMSDREYLTLDELVELLRPSDYGYNYLKQWGVIE